VDRTRNRASLVRSSAWLWADLVVILFCRPLFVGQ
jgi:hypothetical protein